MLHVIPEFSARSGGPATGIVSLAPELLSKDVTTTVSSSSYEVIWASDVTCVPRGRNFSRYQINVSQALWLACNVRRYDVVVLHGAWSFSTLTGWLAARLHQVPFVLFTHGMLAEWFRDHYPVKHRLKLVIWKIYLRQMARQAQGIVFTAAAEVESAKGAFPDLIGRIVIVPYAASAIPMSDELTVNSAQRMLLFLGRLHEKKGVAELLDAVAITVARGKWVPGTRLIIAGSGSSSYEARLREICVEKEITPYVELVGLKIGAEKASLFQQAWFFVLPSWQENFGMTLAEAASAGVPSITTEGVDIHESISASGAGLIIKRPEPTLIAGAIGAALAMTDEQRSEMSRAATELYARQMSPAAVSGAHSDLYRSVSGR